MVFDLAIKYVVVLYTLPIVINYFSDITKKWIIVISY